MAGLFDLLNSPLAGIIDPAALQMLKDRFATGEPMTNNTPTFGDRFGSPADYAAPPGMAGVQWGYSGGRPALMQPQGAFPPMQDPLSGPRAFAGGEDPTLPPNATPVQYAGVAGRRPQQDISGMPTQMPGGGAQMPQGGAMPPQGGGGGPGDRLLAGVLGFGNSGSPMAALANLIGGVATGQRTDPQGVAQRLAELGNTDDIKEYNFAKMQGYKGSLLDWMSAKRAGAGEYGLQAIWGTDAQGNPAITQLGKSGTAIQSKLPEGFKPGKDAQKVDLGTHWGILDPTTRQLVMTIPKDLEGKKAAEEIGEAKGKATVALPTVISNGERMLKQIEEVQNHPGRNTATGPVLGRVPGIAGQQLDFVERMDQLKGQSFLQAYETLKGGGAITEVEGRKGEQAIARLSRAKNAKDIDAALNDLKEVIRTGVENARKKAGGSTSPASGTPAAPARIRKYNPETGKIE